MEERDRLALRERLEVDQEISTTDQVDARQQSISDRILT
jgi:hypothetical protein